MRNWECSCICLSATFLLGCNFCLSLTSVMWWPLHACHVCISACFSCIPVVVSTRPSYLLWEDFVCFQVFQSICLVFVLTVTFFLDLSLFLTCFVMFWFWLVCHVCYGMYAVCLSGLLREAVIMPLWKSPSRHIWFHSAWETHYFLCTATGVWFINISTAVKLLLLLLLRNCSCR